MPEQLTIGEMDGTDGDGRGGQTTCPPMQGEQTLRLDEGFL